jgi:hypothetical protein
MKSADAGERAHQQAAFGSQPSFSSPVTGSDQRVDVTVGRETFEAAVTQFASWINLDPEGMLRGETFEVSGVPVTFAHYGIGDPDGATVIIDYGPFSPETELTVLRTLLEHNLLTPGARQGYFAVGPGLNRILYCIRVNLESAEAGAAAIGQTLGMAVETIRAMSFGIVQQMDALKGNTSAAKAQML